MQAGLQIFDEYGDVVLDTSDSLCRILGQFKADKESGSFTPEGIEKTDRIFAFSSFSGIGFQKEFVPLTIYIDGQTINWRYRMDVVAESGMNEVITYGSY